MPNFDAGTYFLTVMIPVKQGLAPMVTPKDMSDFDKRLKQAVVETEKASGIHYGHLTQTSWTQRLKSVLSTLPTALQSPATERIGIQSPFARNKRNHLARLVVIDDVVYNGRNPSRNPIGDPLAPQHVDHLESAYLLFTAEVDAVRTAGDALPASLSETEQDAVRQAYLEELWATAETELRPVFENCDAFTDINSPADFARYCARYQIETTMPFHDYWTGSPDLKSLPLKLVLPSILVPLAVGVLALLGWIVASIATSVAGVDWHSDLLFWIMLGGFALTAMALLIAYVWVNSMGAKPFPPPQHGDLPSVLKALYAQQKFADFVVANQGADPATLHKKFGEFLTDNDLKNRAYPTQKPGYVSIKSSGALETKEGSSA